MMVKFLDIYFDNLAIYKYISFKISRIMTKILVNEAIKEMPDEFSIDDLIEKLILVQSFEQGRQQYQAGKVFTHQEVSQKLEKWLK